MSDVGASYSEAMEAVVGNGLLMNESDPMIAGTIPMEYTMLEDVPKRWSSPSLSSHLFLDQNERAILDCYNPQEAIPQEADGMLIEQSYHAANENNGDQQQAAVPFSKQNQSKASERVIDPFATNLSNEQEIELAEIDPKTDGNNLINTAREIPSFGPAPIRGRFLNNSQKKSDVAKVSSPVIAKPKKNTGGARRATAVADGDSESMAKLYNAISSHYVQPGFRKERADYSKISDEETKKQRQKEGRNANQKLTSKRYRESFKKIDQELSKDCKEAHQICLDNCAEVEKLVNDHNSFVDTYPKHKKKAENMMIDYTDKMAEVDRCIAENKAAILSAATNFNVVYRRATLSDFMTPEDFGNNAIDPCMMIDKKKLEERVEIELNVWLVDHPGKGPLDNLKGEELKDEQNRRNAKRCGLRKSVKNEMWKENLGYILNLRDRSAETLARAKQYFRMAYKTPLGYLAYLNDYAALYLERLKSYQYPNKLARQNAENDIFDIRQFIRRYESEESIEDAQANRSGTDPNDTPPALIEYIHSIEPKLATNHYAPPENVFYMS